MPLRQQKNAEWTEALKGRIVKTIEFEYTGMTITFEDGAGLEAFGGCAQSTDSFDAGATLPDGQTLNYEYFGQ